MFVIKSKIFERSRVEIPSNNWSILQLWLLRRYVDMTKHAAKSPICFAMGSLKVHSVSFVSPTLTRRVLENTHRAATYDERLQVLSRTQFCVQHLRSVFQMVERSALATSITNAVRKKKMVRLRNPCECCR